MPLILLVMAITYPRLIKWIESSRELPLLATKTMGSQNGDGNFF